MADGWDEDTKKEDDAKQQRYKRVSVGLSLKDGRLLTRVFERSSGSDHLGWCWREFVGPSRPGKIALDFKARPMEYHLSRTLAICPSFDILTPPPLRAPMNPEFPIRPFRPRTPALGVSEAEAISIVEASSLKGLVSPGQPGVMASNWQQLAAVAICPPDMRWLGELDGRNDMAQVHSVERYTNPQRTRFACDPLTDLAAPDHRLRFGEKALRFGGIDLVLRTLHEFPTDERVGYYGVRSIFDDHKVGFERFLSQLAKYKFFLRPSNYRRFVAPRIRRADFSYGGPEPRLDARLQASDMMTTFIRRFSLSDRQESHLLRRVLLALRRDLKAQMTPCVWRELRSRVRQEDDANTVEGIALFIMVINAGGILDPSERTTSYSIWIDALEKYCRQPFRILPHLDLVSPLEMVRSCIRKVVFSHAGLVQLATKVLDDPDEAPTREQYDLDDRQRALDEWETQLAGLRIVAASPARDIAAGGEPEDPRGQLARSALRRVTEWL